MALIYITENAKKTLTKLTKLENRTQSMEITFLVEERMKQLKKEKQK